MVAEKERQLYRQDAAASGRLFSPREREKLIKPYLPTPKDPSSLHTPKRKPVRDFLKNHLHILLFNILHTLFSLYVRIRQASYAVLDRTMALLYYHHRAPELIRQDVRALDRVPEHLSVILDLKKEDRGSSAIEALQDEVAEISAWCACAGVPMLSVYEKTGQPILFFPFRLERQTD